MTWPALVAELTEAVGAPHEARFIADEAIGLGSRPGGRRVRPGGALPDDTVVAARRMAARRAAGEPLQYVFGHWPFRSLELVVDRRVLIPRPETEEVVEVALTEARRVAVSPGRTRGVVAVDAGTGSGAIALSLAAELGSPVLREVWATDTSTPALEVAACNLDALQGRRGGALPPVVLAEGNWLEPLPPRLRGVVDLIVSNPPYVSEQDWEGLEPEVRAEPRRALVAGPGSEGTPGLAQVEAVVGQSLRWLGPRGAVVVELAPQQADAAARLAERLGFDDVAIRPDLARRPRLLVARKGGRLGCGLSG